MVLAWRWGWPGGWRGWSAALVFGVLVLVLAGCGSGETPKDLDLSTSKATEHGLYHVTIEPERADIPVGAIHSWTIRVTSPAGEAVEQATITVDGAMPEHGHGLPTRPQVTRNLGDGRFLVEGMKFNMPGWWTVTYLIDGTAGQDAVTFNLSL